MKFCDEVTTCTTNVCAVIVPLEFILPEMLSEPVMVWLPINVLLPVVAKLLVLAFIDDVNEYNEPVALFTELLKLNNELVAPYKDDILASFELVYVCNELVALFNEPVAVFNELTAVFSD
jgi:hypothetical protein